MTWRFLKASRIKEIQAEIITDFGGSPGVRDEGLLESAVARARNKVAYEDDATVPTVGASMSYGLIKNHAFIDGNKRIGLAALDVFLDRNGYQLLVSAEDAERMVQRTAASEISEQQWTEWVISNALPLT